jgi:hypothetical protein
LHPSRRRERPTKRCGSTSEGKRPPRATFPEENGLHTSARLQLETTTAPGREERLEENDFHTSARRPAPSMVAPWPLLILFFHVGLRLQWREGWRQRPHQRRRGKRLQGDGAGEGNEVVASREASSVESAAAGVAPDGGEVALREAGGAARR